MFPVLWICGPPGAGKSTVAWELFRQRPGAGHVDIDQLGMCYPEVPSDPGRLLLQSRVLGRLVPVFAAAGATSLIVSGCVDPRRGIHTAHLPGVALTALRLDGDRPTLRRRLASRGHPGEVTPAGDAERDALPYPRIDTTGRTPGDVLAIVSDRWQESPARTPAPWPPPVPTPGEVVLLCGTTAVGKSAVGWELARLYREAGEMTGFVDLGQIGFLDGGGHRLRAAGLAAIWSEFHACGARRLVVNGHVDDEEQLGIYAEAMPAATITQYRLRASAASLRDRIRRRGLGEGPLLAGDELRGRSGTALAEAHEVAVRRRRTGSGGVPVDTDGRSPTDIARGIALG